MPTNGLTGFYTPPTATVGCVVPPTPVDCVVVVMMPAMVGCKVVPTGTGVDAPLGPASTGVDAPLGPAGTVVDAPLGTVD